MLKPGVLTFNTDGHPYSTLYRDVYKNRHFARAQARHVFLDGTALSERWLAEGRHGIVEIGFGLGVNFLETMARWRVKRAAVARADVWLDYVGIEAHPLSAPALQHGLRAVEFATSEFAELVAAWPELTPGLHRLEFAGRVRLTLAFGSAEQMIPALVGSVDTIYLDGFAPAINPQAWSPRAISGLARLANPGCRLATYATADSVRENLAANGFTNELVAGFNGKGKMSIARLANSSHKVSPARAGTSLTGESTPRPTALVGAVTNLQALRSPQSASGVVAVVGGGLAGRAMVRALRRRGWLVQWLEARTRDAAHTGLSGDELGSQPALATHLHVSVDDNPLARLTRSAAGLLAQNGLQGVELVRTGRLQLAGDAAAESRIKDTVKRLGFPDSLLRHVDATQASDLAGITLPRGGLWMAHGMLSTPSPHSGGNDGNGIRHGSRVTTLKRNGTGWKLYDIRGDSLAEADAVVFCTAQVPIRALAGISLATIATRGQTTRLRSSLTAALRCVVSDRAYLCPIPGGDVLAGASFDFDTKLRVDALNSLANLAHWTRISGELPASVQVLSDHVGVRHATRDHLPLIGPVVDEAVVLANPDAWRRNDRLALPLLPHIYFAGGFGSRGLLWAALAAEMIGDMLDNGSFLPVERALVEAVAPARMMRRWLRRTPDDVLRKVAAMRGHDAKH